MHLKLKPIVAALAALSVCPLTAFAAEKDMDPIVVTASSIAQMETEATFATEIHTRKMIEKTNATTLYDYLSQYSSVNVMPSYGNTAAPMLDMRGFGLGSGYQNIVVSVDGRRMNSIDMSSPLLSSVPLSTIERIEITKGSGSVTQGDGATAGTILIFTRPKNGISLSSALGSFGHTQNNLSAGLVNEKFDVQFVADTASLDGYRQKDKTGHQDSSMTGSQKVSGNLNLTDALRLSAEAGHTEVDIRYGGAITQAQFDQNPSQLKNSNQTLTHQSFTSDHWKLGGEYRASSRWTVKASTSNESKRSQYIGSNPADFIQEQHEFSAVYQEGNIDVSTGLQAFNGIRTQSGTQTSKSNTAGYILGHYQLYQGTSISAGARSEDVKYQHANTLSSSKQLSAWEVGINQRINTHYTAFATYNNSYQAPDINRFFSTDYSTTPATVTFNGFIEPAKVKTWTLGLNHLTETSKTKAAIFYSRLENEIYLEPVSYKNTNIDKSHKQGLELQHLWKASGQLSLNLNYSYVQAIIDEEKDQNGSYAGKALPGVPRHNILASVAYNMTPQTSLLLSQMWRDQAYAANDFANNFKQRQGIQASTNVALRHKLDRNIELLASVDNLFSHKNGIWIRDDSIYPVSFKPIYKAGIKVTF